MEQASFTVRTADYIKNGLIGDVNNNVIQDFDNNYTAMKNDQNYYEIYSLDLQKILGTLYEQYDYFNIILRKTSVARTVSATNSEPLFICISGFDWTNKQNKFSNEKMMGITYLNDLGVRYNNNAIRINGLKFHRGDLNNYEHIIRNDSAGSATLLNYLNANNPFIPFSFRYENMTANSDDVLNKIYTVNSFVVAGSFIFLQGASPNGDIPARITNPFAGSNRDFEMQIIPNQTTFNALNNSLDVYRGYKTFKKQPIIDFKIYIRTGTTTNANEQSNELLNEASKLYFTFKFDIYPCKKI